MLDGVQYRLAAVTLIAWRRRVYCRGITGYLEVLWHPEREDSIALKGLEWGTTQESVIRLHRSLWLLKAIEVHRGRPPDIEDEAFFRQLYYDAYQNVLEEKRRDGSKRPTKTEVAAEMLISTKTLKRQRDRWGLSVPSTLTTLICQDICPLLSDKAITRYFGANPFGRCIAHERRLSYARLHRTPGVTARHTLGSGPCSPSSPPLSPGVADSGRSPRSSPAVERRCSPRLSSPHPSRRRCPVQPSEWPCSITWRQEPPTPAQLAAWRQLWARLLSLSRPRNTTAPGGYPWGRRIVRPLAAVAT